MEIVTRSGRRLGNALALALVPAVVVTVLGTLLGDPHPGASFAGVAAALIVLRLWYPEI
jgi:hypothetical protein